MRVQRLKIENSFSLSIIVILFLSSTVFAQGISLPGIWEARNADNHWQMEVTWNQASNQYEGKLKKQGGGSASVDFYIGESVWSAAPTANADELIEQQKWRWGGGVAFEWKQGIVYLDKSTYHTLNTSQSVFSRVENFVSPQNINLFSVWENQNADDHWQMEVTWNQALSQYEGKLTKQGALSASIGFSIGELVWTATQTANVHELTEQQKWRSGSNGISTDFGWNQGVIYLGESTYNTFITSQTTFSRVPSDNQAATDCNAVTEISVSECQSLLDLYNSTDGANWSDSATNHWNGTNTPCSWRGVTCNNGEVTQLHRSGNNLVDLLPDLALPALTELELKDNRLKGSIPDFSNLPGLTTLDLSGNQLDRSILDFSNLPELTSLNLSNNQLDWTIPDFSNLPKLTILNLSNNRLMGGIPNFSNLPELTTLNLSNNPDPVIIRSIPDFSNLPALTELLLYNDQLSGSIPDFSNLPALTVLWLGNNQLSGSIPDFSNLPALTELWLGSNRLHGSIPDFSNLPALTKLWLSYNLLSGSIPDFSNLPALIVLGLPGNQLNGNIPDFSNLAALTVLGLQENQLGGNIPDFSNLPVLTELELKENQLGGSIPNFSNLPELTELRLGSNQLSGSIPDFSNLPELTELRLGSNQLSGSIPNFSNLPALTVLWLYANQLSGRIPDFKNLPELTIIKLSGNLLSGSIPNFSNLPVLTELRLGYNQLSGSIPDFNNLPALAGLYLGYNQLDGNIPNFTAFNLADLDYIVLEANCGLTAYDAAQEVMLNLKDPFWAFTGKNCETPLSRCAIYSLEPPNITIPCVGVNNTVYSVAMNLVPAPPAILRFEVDSASIEQVETALTEQCAVYPFGSKNRLRINCVDVNGETLWAELAPTPHPSATQFDLVDFGIGIMEK